MNAGKGGAMHGCLRRVSGVLSGLVMLLGAGSGVAQAEPTAGCGWPGKGNADSVNVAFPDEDARYWAAAVPAVPGARIRMEGSYAHARYFSFHAYDALQRPVGGLADRDLDPDGGGLNPFRTIDGLEIGSYTAYLEFADRPANARPNTFYTGAGNPAGVVIYRVYVPDDPASEAGSVPLPRLTLETADGSERLLRLGECEPLPPDTQGQVAAIERGSSFPNEAPRPVPYPRAENPPFFDRAGFVTEGRVPDNPITDAVFGDTPGFLSNLHVAYLRGYISREHGDVVVVRMKAPTFPDTRAGEAPASDRQVRYWSLCTNEFASQRYAQCASDHEVVLGADGWATFVISDPEDRPTNATTAHGLNYLVWPGAYYDGLLIYRHMLPSATFGESVQGLAVGEIADETSMGDYAPVARYCTREQIEQQGAESCLP